MRLLTTRPSVAQWMVIFLTIHIFKMLRAHTIKANTIVWNTVSPSGTLQHRHWYCLVLADSSIYSRNDPSRTFNKYTNRCIYFLLVTSTKSLRITFIFQIKIKIKNKNKHKVFQTNFIQTHHAAYYLKISSKRIYLLFLLGKHYISFN